MLHEHDYVLGHSPPYARVPACKLHKTHLWHNCKRAHSEHRQRNSPGRTCAWQIAHRSALKLTRCFMRDLSWPPSPLGGAGNITWSRFKDSWERDTANEESACSLTSRTCLGGGGGGGGGTLRTCVGSCVLWRVRSFGLCSSRRRSSFSSSSRQRVFFAGRVCAVDGIAVHRCFSRW